MKLKVEDEMQAKLHSMTKEEVINFTMQLRFERNFLQVQLDRNEDFIPPIPDGKVQQLKDKLCPDELGEILENFVEYVCSFKGYKIGVGHALIQRYLDDTYGVSDERD